jgi:hypothetical protein
LEKSGNFYFARTIVNKYFEKKDEIKDVQTYLFSVVGIEDPEEFIKKGPYQKDIKGATFDPSYLKKYESFSEFYTKLKNCKLEEQTPKVDEIKTEEKNNSINELNQVENN